MFLILEKVLSFLSKISKGKIKSLSISIRFGGKSKKD